MAKKKLLQLDYEIDFYLLGLVCHHMDYRLCHEINSSLAIDLKKGDNLDLTNSKQKEKLEFSLYEFPVHEEKTFYVIANKNVKGALIPEYSQMDYFFMLKGAFREEDSEEMKKKLKDVKIILGVYPINVSGLKSKENLIF